MYTDGLLVKVPDAGVGCFLVLFCWSSPYANTKCNPIAAELQACGVKDKAASA